MKWERHPTRKCSAGCRSPHRTAFFCTVPPSFPTPFWTSHCTTLLLHSTELLHYSAVGLHATIRREPRSSLHSALLPYCAVLFLTTLLFRTVPYTCVNFFALRCAFSFNGIAILHYSVFFQQYFPHFFAMFNIPDAVRRTIFALHRILSAVQSTYPFSLALFPLCAALFPQRTALSTVFARKRFTSSV